MQIGECSVIFVGFYKLLRLHVGLNNNLAPTHWDFLYFINRLSDIYTYFIWLRFSSAENL